MLIKIVKTGEEVPLFYAPYEIDYSRRHEAKCTFIGLNIIFYFLIEFNYALIKMCSVCTRRGKDE